MADNSNLKSPKSTDKPKLTNVIHRTTSESLRLGESENVLNSAGVTQQIIPPIPANNQRAKKPCSFQITSVIVGRMNNDGGDDSADDLDESHADDNSDVIDNSRITDNETPSFSEDTFSKEDIVFNVSNSSLCSAPVIPTSSQYGLAIVSPGSAGNPAIGGGTIGNPITGGPVNAIDVNVTVVNQANVVVDHVNPVKLHEQENKDMQSNPSRNDRFKVVKIESTEPFKRGRWTCMDFLDSANQQFTQMQPTSRVEGSTNANAVGGQYISESAAMTDFRSEQIGPNVNIPIGSNFLQQTQNVLSQQIPVQGNQVQGSQVHMPMSQAQYYNPQQVQGQTNIAHMQSTQQSINTQYSQQSSIQQPIPQTQYPVQQSTHQQQQPISMPGMIVQPGVPTSMAGAYGVAHQSVVQQGPIQSVSHNVVQGTQGQISQLGIVQSQVLPQQNIVQQGQTQNSSSVVSQVPYNQGSSNFTPTSSSVIPSQYLAQNQTFSTQSSQQHIIPQQSVGSMYNTQGVASNVSAQGQSYSGSQVQQNIQGQSYSNPLTQIVGNSLSSQGQSYAGQLSQTVTSNVPTQAQSYAGHTTQSTAGNVSTQAQSYIGQPPQIVGSVPPAQGQSYSQPSLPSNIVPGQGQSFANQQTQTTYAQSVMNQPYVQQPQQQQSNVQQGQNFHGQSQAQTYVSQQQSSYPGVASNQIYSQNVTSMTNVPQSQNYGVSIPSSPATVPQQPIYPTSTQGANAEQPQTYSQPQNYVPTSATGTHEHILTNVGNFPSQGQSYSTVGIVQQSTYPASQQNVPVQSNYRYGTQQTRTSSTYTSSQFKGHSSAQCDEPSPSEIPVSIPVEPSVDTSTVTEENTIPVDDADNAAGNSAVAIDNKIEQAMDLVKSHLMFAVREEVEVLKEKIAELMDRINQLETENSILKAHATQETLAQLNNPTSNGHSQSPATQTISPGSGQQGGST